MTLVETLRHTIEAATDTFKHSWRYSTGVDALTDMARKGATPQQLRDESFILETARTSKRPIEEVRQQLTGDQS